MVNSLGSKEPAMLYQLLSFQIVNFQRTYKCTVRLSFITGFLTAVCLGYFLLFRYMVSETHSKVIIGPSLRSMPASPFVPSAPVSRIVSRSILSDSKPIPSTSSSSDVSVTTIRTPAHLQSINTTRTHKSIETFANRKDFIHHPLILPSVSEKVGFYFGNEFFSVTPQSTELILGIATNTDPKYIAIFAGSLRLRAKSDATVILYVNTPINHLIRKVAVVYQLIIIEFQNSDLQPSFLQYYHPSSLRWILFHRLFQRNLSFFRNYYNKVLTLDIRDSTFQKSPFPHVTVDEKAFFAFGEAQYSRIIDCGWNSGWIKDCFGDAALQSVGDKPIICSGISLSTIPVMEQYLEVMSNTLLGEATRNSSFPKCERNGVDQGIHNYLIHSKQFPFEVSIKYPDTFPIVNMQSAIEFAPSVDDPSTVLMMNGDEFTVIHQYDRNSALLSALGKKYVDWIDWDHPMSEWKQMETCDYFTPLAEVDLLRGKCDAGSTRAMTAASCCNLCVSKGMGFDHITGNHNTRNCTGFTHVNGVCYFKDCSNDNVKDQLKAYEESIKKQDSTATFIEMGAVSAYMKI